jgi:hypothetical protein
LGFIIARSLWMFPADCRGFGLVITTGMTESLADNGSISAEGAFCVNVTHTTTSDSLQSSSNVQADALMQDFG